MHSMITYPNYKFYFPVKALGMYMKRYGDEALFGEKDGRTNGWLPSG